jgi:hypothetical protein
MLSPSQKISDIPRSSNVRRPGLGGGHHDIVNADGKQHRTFVPILALARRVHFASSLTKDYVFPGKFDPIG